MMHEIVDRIQVVLTAVVTWLVALAAVLVIVADELATAIGAEHPVVALCARAVVVVGVAVSIIRRVTPVLPAAQGLLPVPDGVPVTEREAALADQRT